MSLDSRAARIICKLVLTVALAAFAAPPVSAQGSYADEDRYEQGGAPPPPDRYDDQRYVDRRYDDRDRYDDRRYDDGARYDDRRADDRDRYDDRYQASGPPADDYDDPALAFEGLDRYGHWRNHPRYGRVWVPDVDDGWRPYTRGYWVYTEDYGWYWESDEPFGWAAFHYGRWYYDSDEGDWVWVPGNVWGPAWVAWREGDEEMGWAPLPPDAYWYPDRGLVLSTAFYTSPLWASYWIFASPRYMTSPGLHRHVSPRSRSAYYFARTTPRRDTYRASGRSAFNAGIPARSIERVLGRALPSVRTSAVSSARQQGFAAGGNRTVNVFRPQRLDRARSDRWRSSFTRPEAAPAARSGVQRSRPAYVPQAATPQARDAGSAARTRTQTAPRNFNREAEPTQPPARQRTTAQPQPRHQPQVQPRHLPQHQPRQPPPQHQHRNPPPPPKN